MKRWIHVVPLLLIVWFAAVQTGGDTAQGADSPQASGVSAENSDDVAGSDLPDPQVALIGIEVSTLSGRKLSRYRLRVTNWSDYPDELFAPSPDLPPIGRNTRASRTRVRIYSAQGKHLYGFVAFSSATSLQRLWFGVTEGSTPPEKVYVVLEDRLLKLKYKSNLVSLSTTPMRKPAFTVKTIANDKGDKLTVLGFDRPLPAVLKTGERLTVRISYTLASGDVCSIWARPYRNGTRATGYGAHGSARHPKGTAELEGWFTFSSPASINQVGIKMVVGEAGSEAALELLVDAGVRWEAAGATRRYTVPAGGVAELLKFIEQLKEFLPQTDAESAEHQRRAPGALTLAAKRIVAVEKDEWSKAYQTALLVLLEDRVRTIEHTSPTQQQQTLGYVKAFLTAKAKKGLQPQDVAVAISTAKALESAGNPELALKAYRDFVKQVFQSHDEKLSDMQRVLEEAVRRLD